MVQEFYSPGKLLLTAEYFVLDGALALAVPTKLGQEMQVEKTADGENLIFWNARHQGKDWLNAVIDYKNWEIIQTNIPESAAFIRNLLQGISERVPGIFNGGNFYFQTNLQFPSDFGLGSSSTLIANLAKWSGADAFELNETFLKGSGYDIAVAQQESTVLFRNLPEITVKSVDYRPPFADDLILIHLNKKQDSRKGISHYRTLQKSQDRIDEFSDLTLQIYSATQLQDFERLLNLHETKVSEYLGLPTVKELYFSDYQGAVKSLGAWGGDFILTTKAQGWESYFKERNFHSVFGWNELVL